MPIELSLRHVWCSCGTSLATLDGSRTSALKGPGLSVLDQGVQMDLALTVTHFCRLLPQAWVSIRTWKTVHSIDWRLDKSRSLPYIWANATPTMQVPCLLPSGGALQPATIPPITGIKLETASC